MQRFLGAVQFLTLLPIARSTAPPGEAALFFPLIGAVLGAAAGAVLQIARFAWGQSVAALIAILFLIVITGGLHEDGLADVADAFRAGRTREKMMMILKDSRIGCYGALALIVSVLLRWQALANSNANLVLGLAAALALSRTSLVVVAAISPPAGEGLGLAFARSLSRKVAIAVSVEGIGIALACGWRLGAAMALASLAVTFLARAYFVRRLGGVNGDCLGATCQVVETVNLLVLAWRPSI
ncbi:MAG: adenosylcobinamide-GDP ribazoletransferase [Acidobacteriota bacterium]|nr:adenosylcobinamide-GDP ribazoletransferase [Acidobacteriota bacterium]